jgi:exopolysaccharide biosynthesis predicted pyruvyltransferase EpsI
LDEFYKILLKYRHNPFLFIEPNCPNNNNGDRLIYLGIEKVLKSLNIAFEKVGFINNGGMPVTQRPFVLFVTAFSKIIEKSQKRFHNSSLVLERIEKKIHWWTMRAYTSNSSSTVILIGGGANVNDLYGHGTRLLNVVINQNPKNVIIVAPQTYWFNSTQFPKVFQNAKQEIHLFCRERNSYSLLRNMNLPSNVNIHLSPDAALYLTRDDLIPFANRSIDCCYDFLCLRTDKESAVSKTAVIEMVKKSANPPRKLFLGDVSYSFDFNSFVGLIEGAWNVYTDRLHVAILASALGKQTVLFANSYYKSKAVFEYSLHPHVRFITEGV